MSGPRPTRIEHHRRQFRVTWFQAGHRFRRVFPTEVEAQSFLERLSQDPGTPAARVKGGLTVGEVVINWYRDHKRNLSSGTRRDYEGRIRRDAAPLADVAAEEIARNPRRLREHYATLTPVMARRLHAILRQAFQDALVHGEISRNPCDVTKPRRPRAAERLIPSPGQVELMIQAAEHEHPIWGMFVVISATLGTRRAETCALRWEDVEFEARRVHIRRALCKGVDGPIEVKPPKTGRERTVVRAGILRADRRPTRTGWVALQRRKERRDRCGTVAP